MLEILSREVVTKSDLEGIIQVLGAHLFEDNNSYRMNMVCVSNRLSEIGLQFNELAVVASGLTTLAENVNSLASESSSNVARFQTLMSSLNDFAGNVGSSMNLAVRDGFESFTPQVFDFGKRCCNDLCQYLDNLSLSNVRLFSEIHEASSEQLRFNLCGMLDLVGSEILRVRECVNASLSSALGDFSVRFDKLEKLIGDLIRGVPMTSETISPVVVAELIPPGPVSLEYEPVIHDHRIKSVVVQEIVCTHSSPNEIIHCLIFKGYKIQARLPMNVKYVRTNFFKVFAHSGGIPDPSLDQCYFCNGLPIIDNKHKKVIHSHGFRQFGLVQLLTQVVNLNTVSLVINFCDFFPLL
jgi:hypothetical protein